MDRTDGRVRRQLRIPMEMALAEPVADPSRAALRVYFTADLK